MYILLEMCEQPGVLRALYFATLLLDIVFVLVPIGLILMLTLDFSKSLASGEEKTQKSIKLVSKRIIYAVLIFCIPWIISVFMSLLESAGLPNDYNNCLINVKSKNFSYYDKLSEEEERLYDQQKELKDTADNIDDKVNNNNNNNNDNDNNNNGNGNIVSVPVKPDGKDNTGNNTNIPNHSCKVTSSKEKKCYSIRATTGSVKTTFKNNDSITIESCEKSWCKVSSKNCYVLTGGISNCSDGYTGASSTSKNDENNKNSENDKSSSTTIDNNMLREAAYSLVSLVREQVENNNNDSKYGGSSSGWCGHFAVWALKNTNLSNGITLYDYLSQNGSIGTAASGLWPAFQGTRLSNVNFNYSKAYGGDYTPKAGDFVWYQWKKEDKGYCRSNYKKWDKERQCSDHVEIVRGVSGDKLLTIGGNTGDPGEVRERERNLNSDTIIAYGTFYY